MRKHIPRALLGLGLLLSASLASAQYRGRGPDRDDYYRRDVISRALDHVSNSWSYGRVDRHERAHFDQAQRDLRIFQDHWRQGRFDKDRLDGAIENIRDLADSHQVSPREWELLRRDMRDLREFRASRGGCERGFRPY
jgi:hypothetical protein